MENLRRWINLCESIITDALLKKAARQLIQNIDWSGGEGQTVFYMMGYNDDEIDELDTKSQKFKNRLMAWAMKRVKDAEFKIQGNINGNVIRVYRMITAPIDWKPDPTRHPGVYWSWEEKCADAHWGGVSGVNWMMTADVKISQIDWVTTLAANGSPDYENECEITVKENTPIKLLSYKRV